MTRSSVNSVLDEIRQLHDNEESGTLALAGSQGQRVEVFFREGMIEAASSNLGGRRLGDYLAKAEYGTVRDLDALEARRRRRKISFGEAAVQKGLLSPAELETAVRRQAFELLDHAFKNELYRDSFRSHLRFFFAPAKISFPNALLELCRRNAAPLEPATNAHISLVEGIHFSLFHWYPQELYVLSELQNSTTFERLLKTTGLQETNLKKVLGVLDGLGVIEVQDATPIPLKFWRQRAHSSKVPSSHSST